MLSRVFVPAIDAPEARSGPAWWFAFRSDELLVRDDGSVATVPCVGDLSELGPRPIATHYLGTLDGVACYGADIGPETDGADAGLPEGLSLSGLRSLYGRLDEDLFALAGRAVQIVEWGRTHRYCGRCATPTEPMPGERAMRCPNCGLTTYPRLSPAVIVLVTRGEEVLLGRSHHWPPGFYSVLAGFVEAGESLEEAVVREVGEEVGIEVGGLRYFGSQPWPYPNSLMLGFTAVWKGGDLRIDEREIADAGWYRADSLPNLPGPPSIARKLLDHWLEQ